MKLTSLGFRECFPFIFFPFYLYIFLTEKSLFQYSVVPVKFWNPIKLRKFKMLIFGFEIQYTVIQFMVTFVVNQC